MTRVRPVVAALPVLLCAVVVPVVPAYAEAVGNGCEVALVLAPPGTVKSCTYTAPPGTGQHSLMVYGGIALSEVTCTSGYDYLGQPAGHGWTSSFQRAGECVLTIEAHEFTTTATASAD